MPPKRSKKDAEAPPPVPRKPSLQDDDDMFNEPTKKIVIPANQLQLTEKDLAEELTRVLTADDPNVPANITKYNYKDRAYRVDPPGPGDHLKIHFSMDGSAMHRDSDDAKTDAKMKLAEQEAKEEAAAAERGDDPIVEEPPATGKNQFNFSERAAQTFYNGSQDRGVSTEPPPIMNLASTISQWEIFDSYMAAYENEMAEKALAAKAAGKKPKEPEEGEEAVPEDQGDEDDTVHSAAMGRALKVMERLVNQNAEDEIFQDFKYWEDASDQFRDGEGSLLPLWRFSTERTKRKQVTALCWNPEFPDLFAVGYGSYDFMRQGSGVICCFTLKNTSHPEYTFSTESGVMCLDFHPQHHSLLCVGCYDGTVMVFDVRHKVNKPIYASSITTGKHTDPVWQVGWQAEELAKELNFYSISSDGRIANWIMSKNELKMEPVMQLKLSGSSNEDPEETSFHGLAGGSCFDFNKVHEHLFLVGTEEGKIHKCSKAYSGQYLETYQGHHMAVYAVKWNPFHPRVFITCSADWTVKLWDHQLPTPLMSFDLGNAVSDVAWAPYSSSVFAAVTSDGKVHVFDLSVNKHEPLCEQKVVKRAKLTHVTFNSQDPIVLVGDDRGGVNSLKLSPNLRKLTPGQREDTPEEDIKTPQQLEIEKIEKLVLSKPEQSK
jgi:dynein intermediate chain 1